MKNKQRDKEVNRHYKKSGWKVVRVWEHNLKNKIDKLVYNYVIRRKKK